MRIDKCLAKAQQSMIRVVTRHIIIPKPVFRLFQRPTYTALIPSKQICRLTVLILLEETAIVSPFFYVRMGHMYR